MNSVHSYDRRDQSTSTDIIFVWHWPIDVFPQDANEFEKEPEVWYVGWPDQHSNWWWLF